ncbi:hypothetical protein PENSPDRAFT_756655 [Peniophora sp. CONT]|nr:hypothetical protein PENSPDRAFT_756655 [Peniophora sp. CONT]
MTPAWATHPASQFPRIHSTRSRIVYGFLTLSLVYLLSVVLWKNESRILEWESVAIVKEEGAKSESPIVDVSKWKDGAIPIPYTNEQWTPYTPSTAKQPHEQISVDYIHSALSTEYYLPVHPSPLVQPVAQAPDWQQAPLSCLEELIGNGTTCTAGWKAEQRLDFVWTWVNSSDPAWSHSRASISSRLLGGNGKVEVDKANAMAHFRNYDELRHSIRSVLEHFKSYARHFTILASDFAPPNEHSSLPSQLRLGQAPQWLDFTRSPSEWRDGDVRLRINHHANVFRPYFDTIFNSFAIESQLGNLQDVNDLFVYINDDMYFLRDLKPSDFFNSAFGFVFRLQYWTQVPPTLDPDPQRGEWQNLRESNVLIGQRFGPTTRPYRAHMPKIMSVELLHEMAETFSDAFARTGARPMRAVWLDGAAGDIHPGFMFVHFVVERWREGLLWSWAVARMGGDDDAWDADAAWAELRGGEDEMVVGHIVRDTLSDTLQQLKSAGYEGPESANYYFSSMDGYPYYEVRQNETMEHPKLLDPNLCTISRAKCFPSSIASASEAFKHIAFVRPECGDCIINRLVQNSGRRGLSAVLPKSQRTFATTTMGPISETLPRVPSWDLGAFALSDVLTHGSSFGRVVDVRAWTLRMLNRYRFVLADSNYIFARLNNEENAHSQLDGLLGHEKAFACVNDDVGSDEEAVAVEGVMREWQELRWGTPAGWEAA